jgi:hypothetical protein
MTLFLTGVGTRTGGDAHADAHCDAAAGSRQIPALDGIRGLAIIWVVLHNATGIPLTLPASRWLHLFPLLASRGWIGVQLFFALSGFLITAGLLDSQRTAHYFRNFYAKRALRILPLYYRRRCGCLCSIGRIYSRTGSVTSGHSRSKSSSISSGRWWCVGSRPGACCWCALAFPPGRLCCAVCLRLAAQIPTRSMRTPRAAWTHWRSEGQGRACFASRLCVSNCSVACAS